MSNWVQRLLRPAEKATTVQNVERRATANVCKRNHVKLLLAVVTHTKKISLEQLFWKKKKTKQAIIKHKWGTLSLLPCFFLEFIEKKSIKSSPGASSGVPFLLMVQIRNIEPELPPLHRDAFRSHAWTNDIIWTALICKMVDPVSWEVVSEMEHVPFSLHFLVFTLICPGWRTTKSDLLEARIPSVHYPITMIFLKPDGQMGVDPMLLLCCHSRRWHVSKQTRLLLSFHRFSNGLSSAWFHSPLI